MQKFVVGNWKMHGDPAMGFKLVEAVAQAAKSLAPGVEAVVCPPATLLAQVREWLGDSPVRSGGQDCHAQPEGAFTGDLSATMLKAAGATYVIVGHSERRRYHHETNADVRAKASRAVKAGLLPIICIGETENERESGKAEEVVGQQVRDSLPEEAIQGNFLLAYEPVWAIGSGKTPTLDDIRQMHDYILSVASKRTGISGDKVHVLYGGSVKADNARDIMATKGVAGVLVGGASLKAEEFCRIMAAAG